MTSSRPLVILIAGVAYSGSTLLDLLLGTHSRVASVGELNRIDDFLEKNQYCTCCERASACPFWIRALELLGGAVGAKGSQLGDAAEAGRFYRAAAAVDGAGVVVDSSKEPGRARAIVDSGEVDARVVHLVRDGRAVAYSHSKRGESFAHLARHWSNVNAEVRDWLGSDGAPRSVELLYEDLCAAPRASLGRLLDLVGLDWEPRILTDWHSRIAHNVGGNMMRYLDSSPAIEEDLAWREALGREDLDHFEDAAGAVFATFGYRDRGDGAGGSSG